MNSNHPLKVSSEVGTLRKLLIHSPDRGLGKVVPSKAQDWLFEDIVHLDTMRREEYDYYVKILLYFLDPEKVKGKINEIDSDASRAFYKPGSPEYFNSDKVVDIQKLLAEILENETIQTKLIASICAVERCSFKIQQKLKEYDSLELAKILISGSLPDKSMIFAPVPNFIFTRDIGIVINEYILLNKPAKTARTRESLLTQYIFFYHPMFERYRENIIEIPDNEHHFLLTESDLKSDYYRSTLEGGDVMMVAPRHLLIGCSERTTLYAAQQVMKALFERNAVDTITIVKIPKKRDYMHIDTVFTQVKRNMWVLLGDIARQGDEAKKRDVLHFFAPKEDPDRLQIMQFNKGWENKPTEIENLEDLLADISKNDLGCNEPVQFIYSGNNEFPFGAREQWTDSCNLLALKDGVVIGYDRNDKTLEAFRTAGFRTVRAKDLLDEFEAEISSAETITDTFIMLPSAELSRARGGSHCMSLPILRDDF
ncbi:arginine deiminase family protein [Runella slithyformis]|uniref:arginine deiminase n=1 Tax=Runella slithyformis (strain ATCC 29530 / DSM 19594 / LMG 11500 / NCIMB 11436 / LSU 4) TaxID=761193 RepID=A0A7U3ZLR7_RUNSL|nr:arginine deiminase family protein [Runella slithyformis]AEI49536.1 Arginine deiminase [Runella slithyformis DSM 19594]